MTSQRFNLVNAINPSLQFDVAYALKDALNISDELQVLVSSTCGDQYDVVATFSGNALITAPPTNTTFTPTAGEWQAKTVSLANYVGSKNVIVKFRQTRGAGNNLYIDNVRLANGSIGIQQTNALSGVQLSPNPATVQALLSYQSPTAEGEATVRLLDGAGRVLFQTTQALRAGANNYILPTATLPNGVYFATIQTAAGSRTEKLVVVK